MNLPLLPPALAGLFTEALTLTGRERMLLILPLCLCIAVVYKTLRTERLADLPKATFILWITIVVGMYAVGVGLWGVFSILA
jgi:nitric oxide reductase large subunit